MRRVPRRVNLITLFDCARTFGGIVKPICFADGVLGDTCLVDGVQDLACAAIIFDSKSGQEYWLIRGSASQLAISERWHYTLIEQQKVATHTITIGNRRFLGILPSELDSLRDKLREKRLRQQFVEHLACRKKIDKDSARRWLKRKESEGHQLAEILTQWPLNPIACITSIKSASKRHRH